MTSPAAVCGSVLIGPDESRAVLEVHGEIDCSTAAAFRELVDGAAVGRRELVLDLSGVTFMDAAGLGVLAGAAGRQRPVGGSLELRSASELIYRICLITRLTEILHVEPPPTGRRPGAGQPHMSGALSPNGLDHLLARWPGWPERS